MAVDGLDLEVRAGECFGLLGPNGAGKTTTIEILEGLLAPDAGEVEVLGARWEAGARRLRGRLGIQLQETRLEEKLTVEETLRLFRSFYRRARPVEEVLRLVGLDAKRTSRVGRLSGGQRQRLAVGCALVGRPDLLFLDEPTTGLDPQSRRQLWTLLEDFLREGGTVLLTTHYMEEAEALCHRVAVVDRGRVIALGTPAELVALLGGDHVIEFELVEPLLTPRRRRPARARRGDRRAARERRGAPRDDRAASRGAGPALGARAGAGRAWRGSRRTRRRSRTCSWRSPGGTCAMAETWTARSALWQLTLGRVREYLREPEALFWAFAFPAILTLGLGIAFRAPSGAVVHVGVEDGPGAGAIVSAFESRAGFTVERVASGAIETALRDGRVDIVVRPGMPPTYRYDPARAESRLARLAADDALERAAGREDRWTPVEQADEVPGSRYIDWLVPGLLGLNVMSTGLWSIGASIVGTRNRKLLKRLVATPMRRRDYLAAQILARLAFLVPEAVVFLAFARLAFGVTNQGSYLACAALLLLGGMSFSGLGLLIASRARTIEAVSGLLNVVMLPLWLLSGVFFPTSQFPVAMQPIIKGIPLTAFNDALRAVMLDGRPLSAVPLEMGILAVWGLVSFALALRLFRWQ